MKAVILAAGESSRFWPVKADQHKSLTAVCGKPLLAWTINALETADIDHVIIVESPEKHISSNLDTEDTTLELDFVIQQQPEGMGNALSQVEHLLDEPFFVMTPYRTNAAHFIEAMQEKQVKTGANAVLLSTETYTPSKYGILETQADKAIDIQEKPPAQKAPSNQRVVGMYLLPPNFFEHLHSVEEHEYQYEDALAELMDDKDVRVVETEKETNSIKYPWDLFAVADELLQHQKPTIADTATVADTATIDGHVVIGDNTTIYENAVIRGPVYIGENVTIGNSAVVRAGTVIEDNCTVGAYSEIRNSILQDNVSTHNIFLGDSIVDRNSSFGAGTVVANRLHKDENGDRPTVKVTLQQKDETKDTRRNRLGAVVGKDVQVGTQCNLMPGTLIGSRSIIGPSTPVFTNVEADKRHYATFDTVQKDR